jgi:hypothetical protein
MAEVLRMTGRLRFSGAGLPLLGFLFAVGLWLFGVATLPLSQPPPALYHIEPIGEIRGAQKVGQTFVAPYNGLYRVDVFLADYGHLRSGPVHFRLAAGPEGDTLVERSFRAEEIRGDVVYSFQFPALADSAGRHYYFELAAPEAVAGNSITAYIQPSGGYPGGAAFFFGRPVPGDLIFTLSYSVKGWERARIWLEQATADKPGLWGQPVFYVLIGAAYLGMGAGLCYTLSRLIVA